MKSAMLAKIIMAKDLDEVLDRYTVKEIDRCFNIGILRCGEFRLSDLDDRNKVWSDLRNEAELRLATLFARMDEEA